MYEIVKLKEQFHSILKNFLENKEEDDDDVQEESLPLESQKKRSRDVESEAQYWANPEYKKRREQKRLLYQQKYLQSSSKRKVLKFTEMDVNQEEELGLKILLKVIFII